MKQQLPNPSGSRMLRMPESPRFCRGKFESGQKCGIQLIPRSGESSDDFHKRRLCIGCQEYAAGVGGYLEHRREIMRERYKAAA